MNGPVPGVIVWPGVEMIIVGVGVLEIVSISIGLGVLDG
jgi:hypothetical protein